MRGQLDIYVYLSLIMYNVDLCLTLKMGVFFICLENSSYNCKIEGVSGYLLMQCG